MILLDDLRELFLYYFKRSKNSGRISFFLNMVPNNLIIEEEKYQIKNVTIYFKWANLSMTYNSKFS